MRSQLLAMSVAAVLLGGAAKPQGWQASYQSLQANLEAGRCAPALADADALRRATLPAEVASLVIELADLVTVGCNYELGKPERGAAAARAALGKQPGQLDLANLWFESALETDQLDHAMEALGAASSGTPGDISETVEPETVYALLRALRRAGREADAVAVEVLLARNDYGGTDREVRDGLAATAVRAAIESGNLDDARARAAGIVDRYALRQMLTLAAYRPLWPMLEAQVGPGMASSNALALKDAQAQADALGIAEQSDAAADAQARLMMALWNSGQRAQALDVGAQAFASPAALADADERGGWLIDSHAQLLAADGRIDASIRRYDSLTDLGIGERPWLISMRINRAMQLLAHGRYSQLLAGLDALEADTRTYGSPFAMQLVRQLRICGLMGDGRPEEARALLPALVKAEDDAPFAVARTLLCVGETEKAARIVLKALNDPSMVEAAVANLQPLTRADDPREITLRPLLDRPEVAAAYARVGRDLPEQFR